MKPMAWKQTRWYAVLTGADTLVSWRGYAGSVWGFAILCGAGVYWWLSRLPYAFVGGAFWSWLPVPILAVAVGIMLGTIPVNLATSKHLLDMRKMDEWWSSGYGLSDGSHET